MKLSNPGAFDLKIEYVVKFAWDMVLRMGYTTAHMFLH